MTNKVMLKKFYPPRRKEYFEPYTESCVIGWDECG